MEVFTQQNASTQHAETVVAPRDACMSAVRLAAELYTTHRALERRAVPLQHLSLLFNEASRNLNVCHAVMSWPVHALSVFITAL